MSRTVRSPSRKAPERQLLFERFDDAFGRAGIDQVFDVVERHGWLAVCAQPQQPTERVLVDRPMNHTNGPGNHGDELHNRRQTKWPSLRPDAATTRFGTNSPRISEA